MDVECITNAIYMACAAQTVDRAAQAEATARVLLDEATLKFRDPDAGSFASPGFPPERSAAHQPSRSSQKALVFGTSVLPEGKTALTVSPGGVHSRRTCTSSLLRKYWRAH